MESLASNGVNGATGDYLLPELSAEDLAKIARNEGLDEKHLAELQARHQALSFEHLGVEAGVDPDRLDQSGWGVVFVKGDDEDGLREALQPLLEHRKAQAQARYKEFGGKLALEPGQSHRAFLAKHLMSPSEPADPDKVPYYLLLVGGPKSVSYRVQYQLDVNYAVGRLQFDTLEAYARYAEGVVAAEQGKVKRGRTMSFFAPRNALDRATNLSAERLVGPLVTWAKDTFAGWKVEPHVKTEATKAQLSGILSREDGPAFLFTASHGMGFPKADARQRPHQGALLCQDWPGPAAWHGKPIPESHYFSGDDLGDAARVAGLVAFHFACYGAGTPQLDDFAHQALRKPVAIADEPFVARLPQRLLGHPKGTALAVVGHVDRAWGYSFVWPGVGEQLGTFQSAIRTLLEGSTVGAAMEYFNSRYAALSTELTSTLNEPVPDVSDEELAGMWTANNDAKSYVILGDPAVRLSLV